MSVTHTKESIQALEFVNMLVPGKFEDAREMLSPDCLYYYSDQCLEGEAVLDSFIENHNNASAVLEKITYIDGSVGNIKSNGFIDIIVKDLIEHKDQKHLYKDCLSIKIENGFILEIRNLPFIEEREKLSHFLNKIDVSL